MTKTIRRKAREIVLQCLYQAEFQDADLGEIFFSHCEHFQVNKKAIGYSLELINGLSAHREELNQAINKTTKNWRLDRMAVIDRNILRLAAYELLYDKIPAGVVINEAIEIARQFSTDESVPFINGILDAICLERA